MYWFIIFVGLWLVLRHKRATYAFHILGPLPCPGFACRGKTDKEKLEEFRKMAKLYRDHTSENSINQSNSGVSLINFQWPSFAGGASALGVVTLICGAIILCCLWKAKAGGDVARIWSAYSRPLVPLVPRLMNTPPLLPPLPGPESLPPLPLPSPDQTGLGPPPGGRVFPHHWIRWDSEASVPPIPAIIIRRGLQPVWLHFMPPGHQDASLSGSCIQCWHPLRHHVQIHRVAGRGRQGQEI